MTMRRNVLLAACAALTPGTRLLAATTDGFMEQNNLNTHKANPKAPAALSHFGFLLGEWHFDAKFKSTNGESQTFHGTWVGRHILDGHVIADEYKMFGSSKEVIVHGMNFRVYDAAKKTWNIKWMDLTPEEFGGAKFEGQSVSYIFREPMGASGDWKATYTRATYTSVSPTFFSWRGEKSDDRTAWEEFMVVECHRSK